MIVTEPLYSVPESTFLQQPRRMLPQAMGATSISDAPADGLTMARQRYKSLQDEIDRLRAQEPDFSAMQEFARRQGEMGQNALLNAIAAQYAGEAFQPLQAKFLRQAEASQQPLRIGSTMITPSGEIIRDPTAQQQKQLGILSTRADRAAGEIGLYERARDREAAEAARQRDRIDAANQRAEADRQLRLMLSPFLRGGNAQAQPVQDFEPPAPINRIITPNIQLNPAMGIRGVAENAMNRLVNAVGGGNPDDPSRETANSLDALATLTRETLSKAFEGKDSVYLLKLIEGHVIRPNELFTGVSSIPQKARANIGILEGARDRIRQNISVASKPQDKAKASRNLMAIEGLIKEYQTLEEVARRQANTAAPQIAPRGQQQPAGNLSPAEQRELEALRARFGRQ
jgi:hypothetical protein